MPKTKQDGAEESTINNFNEIENFENALKPLLFVSFDPSLTLTTTDKHSRNGSLANVFYIMISRIKTINIPKNEW